jgi:hypothetical protein
MSNHRHYWRLVKGGQGHEPAELEHCASVTGLLMLCGAVVVIVAALVTFGQH